MNKYRKGDVLKAEKGNPFNEGCEGEVVDVGETGGGEPLYWLTGSRLGPWREFQVTLVSSNFYVGQPLYDTEARHGANITGIHEVMDTKSDSTTYYSVTSSNVWFTETELKARFKKIKS